MKKNLKIGIRLQWLGYITIVLALVSCKKYLNEKSNQSLSTLSTLADLQALLDNYSVMNTNFSGAGEVSATDFYLTDAAYDALSFDEEKNMYHWNPESVFYPATVTKNDWQYCYQAIYYCNSVLDALPGITDQDNEIRQNIEGEAYFWRAFRYFDAAQIWCLPYDSLTAGSRLGLPLRMDPDFNEKSVRSDLQTT